VEKAVCIAYTPQRSRRGGVIESRRHSKPRLTSGGSGANYWRMIRNCNLAEAKPALT